MNKIIKFTACIITALYASTALAGGLTTEGDSNSTSATVPTAEVPTAEVPASTSSASTSTATTENNQANGGGFVAIEDDPLIVDASAIMDDDGMGEVSVQWQISNSADEWKSIAGANQQSFTPRQVHVDQRLRVVISYVDGQGNLETLVSPASTPVQNVNDKPTGAPMLIGAAREDDALVVDISTIADEDGLGPFEVIWQRSTTKTEWQAYPAATSEVLRLGQENVGFSYRAVITYVDGHDTREVLISNPSETIINVDDPVEGEIVLQGEPVEGKQISVDAGGVSDEDGIASLSVSWEYSENGRNWRAIDTSSSSVIKLGQSLVGKQVRAKASVVDTFGVETLIYSKPTNAVENVNNNPVGTINVRRVGS